MKKAGIIVSLWTAVQFAYAQQTRSLLSDRYVEAGVYSKNFTDAFSGSVNQAALAGQKKISAAVYGERRFMLKELSNYTAALVLPSALGGFGVAIHYFGGENFNSSQLGIGYGKKLDDKIAIGVQFNYNHTRLAGYGSSGVVNFEAGVLFHLSENLHFGIHAYNPLGSRFGKNHSEKLPSVYTTGLGYELSGKLLLGATIKKMEDEPVNINTSIQYRFEDHFFLRVGTGTSTAYYFFGFGLQWKNIRLDAISSWETRLGFTPGIMLLFNLRNPKQPALIEE